MKEARAPDHPRGAYAVVTETLGQLVGNEAATSDDGVLGLADAVEDCGGVVQGLEVVDPFGATCTVDIQEVWSSTGRHEEAMVRESAVGICLDELPLRVDPHDRGVEKEIDVVVGVPGEGLDECPLGGGDALEHFGKGHPVVERVGLVTDEDDARGGVALAEGFGCCGPGYTVADDHESPGCVGISHVWKDTAVPNRSRGMAPG